MGLTPARCHPMYYQFLRFCADVIDYSVLWDNDLVSPLEAPLPMGTHRHLRIDPRLKQAVADEAAAGRLGKSGAQVCKALARFRNGRLSSGDWNVNVGNKWMSEGALRDFAARREALRGLEFRCTGIAMDATRFGGNDCLYLCLQDVDAGYCCWAQPQVHPPPISEHKYLKISTQI